jgi:hypothetical protein
MKTRITLLLLIALPISLSAQRLQGRFVTSAYAWETQSTLDSSVSHVYGYQTLQLSYATGDVQLNTYLQGFNDFAGPYKNDFQFRMYNLFLRWRNIGRVGELSVGRQYIAAGPGNGIIDGALGSVRLWDSKVRLVGFWGILAPAGMKAEIRENASENALYGGQLILEPVPEARVSVGYSQKKMKAPSYTTTRPDSLFNPYPVEINPSAEQEQYLSGELRVESPKVLSGYFRYDFDVNTEKTSRFQLFARGRIVDDLWATGEYLQREPRIAYNSFFSAFTYSEIKDYEVGLEYGIASDMRVFGKYGAVSYGDEDQWRLTVGGSWKYISASISHNTGDDGRISALSLNAGYPLWNRMLTPTLAVTYASYKLSQYDDLNDALSVAPGVVYRPVGWLSVDGQMQWLQNTIYKNDLRFMVRASYFFSERLEIF